MLDARWQLWHRAYESGETCGEPFGEGRWRVTCNLPPGHRLPHEARRGIRHGDPRPVALEESEAE